MAYSSTRADVDANGNPITDAVSQGTGGSSAWKVDGSGVTQPVSATALPLPAGAATAAKQPAPGTAGTASADVITVQGIGSMTALKVDGSGVTQPVSGTFWQATQPVSGTFWQATQPVSGTVTANAGSGTFNVGLASLVQVATGSGTLSAVSSVAAGTAPLTSNATSLTAGSFIVVTTNGNAGCVSFYGTGGSAFTGQMYYETSIDNTNWFPALPLTAAGVPYYGYQANSGVPSGHIVNCVGANYVRIRVPSGSTFSSGTNIAITWTSFALPFPVANMFQTNQGSAAVSSNFWYSRIADGSNSLSLVASSNPTIATTSVPVIRRPSNRTTYMASTNGTISTGTTASTTISALYLWHPSGTGTRTEILKIWASVSGGNGSDFSLRVNRLSGINGTPGGSSFTPIIMDNNDGASGCTLTYGATGAPTRAGNSCIVFTTTASTNSVDPVVLYDAQELGKALTCRTSTAEGWEVAIVTGGGTFTTAANVAVHMLWTEY